MRNIPMDLLRTLATVAECGSVTRAASTLGRSQPATSLQMRRLEELVGLSLFQWDGRQMRLTDPGEALLDYAQRILQLNDEALGSLTRPVLAGHVVVGTPNDFAISFLPRILGRFAARYPNVTLDVTCDLSVSLIQRFKKGRSDLDIVLAMQGDKSLAGATRQWFEQLAWIDGPAGALHLRRPLPLVVYPEGCVYRRRMIQSLDRAGISWRIVYCSQSLAGLQAAVISNLGVTVLARSTVPQGLQILEPGRALPPLADVTIGLYRRRARLSAAAGRLVDFLAESLDAMPLSAARGAARLAHRQAAAVR